MKLDIKKVSNLEFEWNGQYDYPEFTNAFVSFCLL